MRLRTHLIALVLAALVPLLGFAALVIRDNARLQLAVTERGTRETARAVAHTVDATLDAAITALQALAESEHLDPGNLSAFHALCQRVAHAQGWTNILVFDPEGRALMNTSAPLGAPLAATRRPAVLAQARDTRRPAVSNLFDGAFHRNIVAVYVPVVRNGTVRFVMSAALPAADLGAVLRAQQFGPEGVAVLQDRDNVVIARTRGETEMVGRRIENATPGQEGWTRSRLFEGPEVYVAFATAPLSGWRVVLTVPVEIVGSPQRRALWQMLAGATVAAALAGGLAFLFGRRIAGAVGSLVRIARAVEGNRPSEPLRTGVTEVNALAEQLRAAADLARVREQEVAARERQARTIGEMAHALNASPDLDGVLRTAVEAVRGLVRADFARIALVDEAGRLVLCYSTTDSTAMPPGFVIERGHGLGGLVWDTGVPVRTDDFGADPRFHDDRYLPIANADGIVSCMAVPIVTAGAVAGVIYANNRAWRPFTASDEAALVTLANHAAVAVQKARLLAGEHAARAEAEAASRGKDELLAMLGHELRNPLSAIATAAHVLGRADLGEEPARRALAVIARQNGHLTRLVDDLLDVARVTAGKITLAPQPVELADAVQGAVATLTASGRTERHRVTLDLKPVWSHVDPTRFEQVVINLVSNALRFTPVGGTVDVVIGEELGNAVLCVRDSGVGLAPEMLRRVFDPFVQAERGPDRGPGGLGLGLTLVRRIAELHGGTVEAVSDGPGRGSAFTVRLPALPAPSLVPGLAGPATGVEGVRRRILVVEDNEDAREMLRLVLGLAGHEVHDATDGPAGLEAALRLRPDIALIDVGLPGFDGYELARRLRAAVGASIHLVALTGYGQPEDRRRAQEAGFDAHLVKPIDQERLRAAIPVAADATKNA